MLNSYAMFQYKIKHSCKKSGARTGILSTPHGEVHTPVFMPVGTKATVKTLSPDELTNISSEIILANTYHLYIRPGEKLVKEMGGLHKWMSWNKPILTDSGGFQVFSLSQQKEYGKDKGKTVSTVKIKEDGVQFKSHLDGSAHFFTPEKVMQIEHDLGADIIMAFDECAPADSSESYFKKAMERTHRWLDQCIQKHNQLNSKQEIPQALFPIIQGGLVPSLRQESAKYVSSKDLPGIAIGGLSVGESKSKMSEMINNIIPHIDQTKPRYLMGVGTPEDLLNCIDQGIDMFDCVHPTRMARHGAFWTTTGRYTIKNEQFRTDESPLQKGCNCYSCQNFSKSYIRHLIFEKEILGLRLMSIHNLAFLINLTHQIRQHIEKDTFHIFKKSFLEKYEQGKQVRKN